MSVVVSYLPGADGRAALDRGIIEARLRGRRWPWSTPAAATPLVDDRFLQGSAVEALRAELAGLDVSAELRQADTGLDVAEHPTRSPRRWTPSWW